MPARRPLAADRLGSAAEIGSLVRDWSTIRHRPIRMNSGHGGHLMSKSQSLNESLQPTRVRTCPN